MSQASPNVGVPDLQVICKTLTAYYRGRLAAGRSGPEAYGDSLFYWCSYIESADKYKPAFPATVAQQLAHSGTDSASDTEKKSSQTVVRKKQT